MGVDEGHFGEQRKKMSKSKRKELTVRNVTSNAAVVVKDRATRRRRSLRRMRSRCKDSSRAMPTSKQQSAPIDAPQPKPHYYSTTRLSSTRYGNTSRAMSTPVASGSCGVCLREHNKGAFHEISPRRLNCDVQEFARNHDIRELDAIEQIQFMQNGMDRKRLTYKGLTVANGLASRARSQS